MNVITYVRLNQAAIVYAVNTAVALGVSVGLDLDRATVAAVTTATAGACALIAALSQRPVLPATLKNAVTVLLIAGIGFGLKLPPERLGVTAAGISLVVGLLLHNAFTPALAYNQGTTAQELLLAAAPDKGAHP